MRTCKGCGAEKPLSDFYAQIRWGRTYWGHSCKSCIRRKQQPRDATYYAKHRPRIRLAHENRHARALAFVNEYKATTPCTDCGQCFDPICMDFDHLPGQGKTEHVARMVARGMSIEQIQTEIARCELVCANCHRIRTRDRYEQREGQRVYGRRLLA